MKQIKYMNGRPRSTHFRAVQILAKKYRIDPRTGLVYNKDGQIVGGTTYEPKVTVYLEGKKYNARIHKAVAYVGYGPEALRRGVSVRHLNGDKFDNRIVNLKLQYNREAAKALRRRLREAQLA